MKLQQHHRNRKGSFYVLYVGLIAMLLVIWSLFANVCMNWIVSYRNKCALEAAALGASCEMSRIVIDDPNWGFVALSDQPPIGDGTRVRDGYPLPVTGANTILATARMELIVAHTIGTNEAIECAQEDLAAARAAVKKLSRVLRYSLRETEKEEDDELIARDIHGVRVYPLESAKAIYKRNAEQLTSALGWKMESLKAELGWLDGEGTTNTPLPGADNCAALDDVLLYGKQYPAFVDVPAFGESFHFAGMGKQAGLVESSLFEKFDIARNCSVVKLDAQLTRPDSNTSIQSIACAQPAYIEDKVPASYMVLRLPDGAPSNINSIRELLTSEYLLKNIPMYTASGGDYPNEPNAVLKENPGKPFMTVRYALTRAFFDWLRTAHAKPQHDSVISALDYRFNHQHSTNTFLLSIDQGGQVTIDCPRSYPFTMQTAYERQLYTVAFDAINTGGATWTIRLRDQVHRLGRTNGGKHGGQPMPSLLIVDRNQDESQRVLEKAGSRYDRSRLALEVEICSPRSLNTASAGGGL